MKRLLFGLWFVFLVSRFSSDGGGCGVDGALIELKGPTCGTLTCKADEYCDQFIHGCTSCRSICEANDHNFDGQKCKSECEVYIYDQRYFRRTEDAEDENLKIAVQKLQLKYTVVISLFVVVIIVLIVVLIVFVWTWKRHNNVTWASFTKIIPFKKSENNTNGVSANKVSANDQITRKPDLRLEITANSIQSDPTPITATTGITPRIPAEDSIDYAYDNPAMSNSPKKSLSTTS